MNDNKTIDVVVKSPKDIQDFLNLIGGGIKDLDKKVCIPSEKVNHCGCGRHYRYDGREVVDYMEKEKNGIKPFVSIKWLDGTTTKAELADGEKFDLELGIMICYFKKFVHGVSLKRIYELCKDNDAVKEMMKYIVIASGNKKAYSDIRPFMQDIKKNKKLREDRIKRFEKSKKRKEAFNAKMEKLKKDGKYVSQKEMDDMHQRYEKLKKLERYNYEKEEVAKMEKKGIFG